MKLTSLAVLSLLAALSFAPSSLASSDPYVVSGVKYDNPWASEFYFDSTKGSTLVNAVSTSVEPFIKAWKENAEKTSEVMNFTFLGNWEERIDKNSTWYQDPRDNNYSPLTVDNIDAYAVQQLVSIIGTADRNSRSDKGMALDGNMCWAHTAANMLQYWQCYYGIFATNTSAMQHGYAVEDAAIAKTMLGVQSLNTTKWFYDHFTNNGADLSNALGWYLDYDANKPTKSLKVFDDYFSSATAATTVKSVGTIEDLTKTVLSLMGVDKAADGTISTNTYGQLIGLNIGISGVSDTGHSLTMYGFGLGDDGQINRLIYADSNVANRQGLITVYVKENNGALVLYEDALCQKLLEGKSWQISNLMAINTPDSLRDMGRQYAEGDLVWMGGSTWKAGQGTGSMATAMPTDATGWQVSVNGDYYNSYFDASRNVRFNDDGNPGGEIKISGTAKAHNMTIDAVSKDYTFNAANSGAADSIALAGDLIKSGAAKASFGLKISAAGLSVKGGTLAVGSGCTLAISGTSMIERGTTLSVGGGGTASLGNATFAAGSVLSVSGTQNTLNASSLTFADGARLSFDLSNPDAKSNTMLTINVTPNFKGKVYFDFVGGNVDEEYKLIYFGGSAYGDWLNNFVSYNGTFSLSGNTLVLKYADEKKATWNGSSGTWSAATTNWKDAANPENAVVNFTSNTATQTVTVSGTVNPSAINVTGGSYVFKSDATTPGSISGSRDLTISGGASLESQMSLGEHAVVVKGGSSFTYNVDSTGSIGVSELRLEDADSSATFKGKATYNVHHASLSGKLSVQDTANLVLHSDATVASVTLKDQMGTDAQLSFRNSSNSGMVQYTLSTKATQGTINVGSIEDFYGTSLKVSNAATKYVIAKGSTLSVDGKFESSFSAKGDGKVLVAEKMTFAGNIVEGTLSDANLFLEAEASVNLTSSGQGLNLCRTLNVEGGAVLNHVHTYIPENGDPVLSQIKIGEMILNDSTYRIQHKGEASIIATQIQALQVRGTGTIYQDSISQYSYNSEKSTYGVEIGTLSGDGALSISREYTGTTSTRELISYVSIGSLGDYSGSIKFVAGVQAGDGTGSAAGTTDSLVLGGGSMTGVISVEFNRGIGNWAVSSNLVFSGDTTIGGLKSTALNATSKYPKSYDKMRLAGGSFSAEAPTTITSPTDGTRYTLTIKTQSSSDDYTYTGHVGEGLNLAKQGEGKQSFVGDLSKFSGDVEVKGGTLVMTSSTENSITLDDPSNTTLNTTSLSISGGATLESNLTVKVSGAFVSKAYVSDLVGTAAAATLLLGDAVGTTATTNPVASLSANTDLSDVASLNMETTVDLGGKSLTLWSETKELTLSDSMFELQTDGTYKVTLFTNIGTLTGLDSDSVLADTKFTTPQGWLSDGVTLSTVTGDNGVNLVLANIQYIPEPTTATLALLGLMGLCARRRRQKSASSN